VHNFCAIAEIFVVDFCQIQLECIDGSCNVLPVGQIIGQMPNKGNCRYDSGKDKHKPLLLTLGTRELGGRSDSSKNR
jgi:hypothetical protein